METVGTVLACRDRLDQARATRDTVRSVPTMGALHAGHLSLIDRAQAECDVVAVTIFVNPLQFGDPQDIAHYPRTLDADLAACAAAAASTWCFAPSVTEMYPNWPAPIATTVTVSGVSTRWKGASPRALRRCCHRGDPNCSGWPGPSRVFFGEKRLFSS